MDYVAQLLTSQKIKLENYLKDNHYKSDASKVKEEIKNINHHLILMGCFNKNYDLCDN